MVKEMTTDEFYNLSYGISRRSTVNELKTTSKEFAKLKNISNEEAFCIHLIAYDIRSNDSFKSFYITRDRRIRELEQSK